VTVRLFADEHVPSAVTATLRSNGYTVVTAQERYGQDSVDIELLRDCGRDGLVVLTNDRDFVELNDRADHAGIVVYTTPNPSPSAVAVAIDRIERSFADDELQDQLVWLESWL
jgi:predicted nuclease of predicted toxin-antitoxin system